MSSSSVSVPDLLKLNFVNYQSESLCQSTLDLLFDLRIDPLHIAKSLEEVLPPRPTLSIDSYLEKNCSLPGLFWLEWLKNKNPQSIRGVLINETSDLLWYWLGHFVSSDLDLTEFKMPIREALVRRDPLLTSFKWEFLTVCWFDLPFYQILLANKFNAYKLKKRPLPIQLAVSAATIPSAPVELIQTKGLGPVENKTVAEKKPIFTRLHLRLDRENLAGAVDRIRNCVPDTSLPLYDAALNDIASLEDVSNFLESTDHRSPLSYYVMGTFLQQNKARRSPEFTRKSRWEVFFGEGNYNSHSFGEWQRFANKVSRLPSLQKMKFLCSNYSYSALLALTKNSSYMQKIAETSTKPSTKRATKPKSRRDYDTGWNFTTVAMTETRKKRRFLTPRELALCLKNYLIDSTPPEMDWKKFCTEEALAQMEPRYLLHSLDCLGEETHSRKEKATALAARLHELLSPFLN